MALTRNISLIAFLLALIYVPVEVFAQEDPLVPEPIEQNSPSNDEGEDSEVLEESTPVDTLEVAESVSFADEVSVPATRFEEEEPEEQVVESSKKEEPSESMISFNFLYYLLQKFKLSDSLRY